MLCVNGYLNRFFWGFLVAFRSVFFLSALHGASDAKFIKIKNVYKKLLYSPPGSMFFVNLVFCMQSQMFCTLLKVVCIFTKFRKRDQVTKNKMLTEGA